jgi:branched-chain amino acid aminotransferase
MIQLQKPEWIYFDGKIRKWEEGVLHISCEAVYRGLSVFEGLKGYWKEDGTNFGIVAVPRHYARLQRSARLLHIPCPVSYDEFEQACHELVRALYQPDRDMWIRATLYVVEGHWGEGTVADLVLIAYHQDKIPPKLIDIGVSTWQRASDVTLPPRIKTSANYQVARLARIEGRGRGYSEMVLLNQWGRVAEATGACILMVLNDNVVTPPPSEGRLESITIEIVANICNSLGIDFVERPIDRTELYIADELSLAGTLAELTPIRRIDDYVLPDESPILNKVRTMFWNAVRGIEPHPGVDLSMVKPTNSSVDSRSPYLSGPFGGPANPLGHR